MGYSTKPSGSWFRLGFPSGYVADVLQVLEAACAAGFGHDPRLGPAVEFVLARQDDRGRWTNDYAYGGDDRRHRPTGPTQPMGDPARLPGPPRSRLIRPARRRTAGCDSARPPCGREGWPARRGRFLASRPGTGRGGPGATLA